MNINIPVTYENNTVKFELPTTDVVEENQKFSMVMKLTDEELQAMPDMVTLEVFDPETERTKTTQIHKSEFVVQ